MYKLHRKGHSDDYFMDISVPLCHSYTLKNLKWTGMAFPFWVRINLICFLTEMHFPFSFTINAVVSLYLHQILSENGKPLAATSEWNFHFQMKYPYWECTEVSASASASWHPGFGPCLTDRQTDGQADGRYQIYCLPASWSIIIQQ